MHDNIESRNFGEILQIFQGLSLDSKESDFGGIVGVQNALDSMDNYFWEGLDQNFVNDFTKLMPFLQQLLRAKPGFAKLACRSIQNVCRLRYQDFSELACALIPTLANGFAGLQILQLSTIQCCEEFTTFIPDDDFSLLETFAITGINSEDEQIKSQCFKFVYILLSKHTEEQKTAFPNSPQLDLILNQILGRSDPYSINLLAVLDLYYTDACQFAVLELDSDALQKFTFYQCQYLLDHDLKRCFEYVAKWVTLDTSEHLVEQCRVYFDNILAKNPQFVDSLRFSDTMQLLEEGIFSKDKTEEYKQLCIVILAVISHHHFNETEELILQLSPEDKDRLLTISNDLSDGYTPAGLYAGDSDDDSDSEDNTDEFRYESVEDLRQHLVNFLLSDERLTWKMIDFLAKDEVVDVFFNILSHIENEEYFNLDEDEDKQFKEIDYAAPIEPCREPDRANDDHKHQLSFALMVHFHPESIVECVKSFLILKMAPICQHTLACFHPASNGNVYHASIILSSIVRIWTKTFVITILDKDNLKELFRNVLTRCIHWGHVEDAVVDLLAMPVRDDPEFQEVKKHLYDMVACWEVIEGYCEVIARPNTPPSVSKIFFHILHNMLDRLLFCDNANNILKPDHESEIVFILMEGALNPQNPNRIRSADMLSFWLQICSSYVELDPIRAMMQGFGSDCTGSQFLGWFPKSMDTFEEFLQSLCSMIKSLGEEEEITLSSGASFEPVGLYRHSLVKLLSVAIQSTRGAQICKKIDSDTCSALFSDCFRFKNNTVYLNNFSNIFRGSPEIVQSLLETNMIDRCYDFTSKDENKYTGLFGFIMNWFWGLSEPLQKEAQSEMDLNFAATLQGPSGPEDAFPVDPLDNNFNAAASPNLADDLEDFLQAPETPDPPEHLIQEAISCGDSGLAEHLEEQSADKALSEITRLLKNHPRWNEFYSILREHNEVEESGSLVPEMNDIIGFMMENMGSHDSNGELVGFGEVLQVDTNPFETYHVAEDDEQRDLIEAITFPDDDDVAFELHPPDLDNDFIGDGIDDMD